MKFRSRVRAAEDIKLNMTAMIDIVFQLLVFFIMTFKVTAMEADFNIRMPVAAKDSPPENVPPTCIYVTLRSGTNAEISGIDVDVNGRVQQFNDKDMYQQLTRLVEETITDEGDPSSQDEIEVEFTIAELLKYGYTVKAIEAVSGKVEGNEVKKLIEKIKFRNPGQ